MRSRTHVTLTASARGQLYRNEWQRKTPKITSRRGRKKCQRVTIMKLSKRGAHLVACPGANVTNKRRDWTKGSSYLLAVHEANAKRHASALKSAN